MWNYIFENKCDFNGAPAQSTKALQNLLNEKYSHRWIGRKGFVTWPLRLFDLMSLFFMGLRQRHYTLTRDNMIVRITTTLENIPLGILRAGDYLKHRIYLCRRVQSQNFEYLLYSGNIFKSIHLNFILLNKFAT